MVKSFVLWKKLEFAIEEEALGRYFVLEISQRAVTNMGVNSLSSALKKSSRT